MTCNESSGLAVAQTLLVAIMQISCRGAQIAMTKQQLDRAEIGAGLQQVNRKRVAQGMRRDRLADAALRPHVPTGVIDGGWRDRLAGPVTGKQPLSGMGALPIVPQDGPAAGRQHDVAIFPAFALLDADDHALAVDRRGLQADRFGNPQTGRVTDGQDHAVLQVVHGVQESARLRPGSSRREAFSPRQVGISSSTAHGRLRVTV